MAFLQAEPLRIMPVGDSITRGLTNAGPIPGGYRTRLYSRLSAELLATQGVDFVGSQSDNPDPGNLPDPDHEGRGGWRIDEHLATIENAVRTYAPAIVLLHLGTNDVAQNYALGTAPDRLDQLISLIVSRSPGTYVIVAQIINSPNATESSQIQTYNAAIPAIVAAHQSAGHHVSLVNMYGVVSPANMSDTYHPNNVGFDQIADAWFAAVSALGPVSNPVLPVLPGDSIVQTNAAMAGVETGFPASAADLLAAGGGTLASAVHSDYSSFTGTGTTGTAALSDGLLGSASTNTDTAFDLDGQWTSTYTLNTGIAPGGYDISEIRTISGWQESRTSQTYELFFAFAGDPGTYISHGTFAYSLGTSTTSKSTQISLTEPTGVIASGVVSVRFAIFSPGSGRETVYREIDVLGKPTLIVPNVTIGSVSGGIQLALDRLVPGSTVTVQRSADLSSGVWQDVAVFSAASSQSLWSEPLAGDAQKVFYRVKVSR